MREEGLNRSSEYEEEQAYIRNFDQVIDRYREMPGRLIPVLQEAQKQLGYLPEPLLKKVSLAYDEPYSHVAGVVSFYSYFSTQPRGRHTVRVCLGTACYVRGGKEVLAAVKENLGIDVGETTEDRLFSLDVGRCFGACGLAPVMLVDEDVHQRVRPSRVKEILAGYRQYGMSAADPGSAEGRQNSGKEGQA